MEYSVNGVVTASAHIGTVEAGSLDEAVRKAIGMSEDRDVSACHQCSRNFEDPEITSINVAATVGGGVVSKDIDL